MCILMTIFSPYSAVYTTRHLSIYNWFKEKIDIVKETHFTAAFLNSDDWRILDEPFLSFFSQILAKCLELCKLEY